MLDPTGGVLGSFDRFTSFEAGFDLENPSEASFELGDDGSFAELARYIRPGNRYRVSVNDRAMLHGKVEAEDVPLDAACGAVVRFIVRSRLSEASYGSARPFSIVKATLGSFVFGLYGQMGLIAPSASSQVRGQQDSKSDFIVRASLARELITGKRVGSAKRAGGNDEVRLTEMKVSEARVRPPETIYMAADRHLRRFGLMHWDGPDGRIVIGAPDDTQEPTYYFNACRGPRSFRNNSLSAVRTLDYGQVPSVVGVYGVGQSGDVSRSLVRGFATDPDVHAAGLHHPVILPVESLRNQAAANSVARREMAQRSRRKDSFQIEVDGLSFWDADFGQRINWALDTVISIETDVAGGDVGSYYLHSFTMKRDAARGDCTRLMVARQGAFRLEEDVYQGGPLVEADPFI